MKQLEIIFAKSEPPGAVRALAELKLARQRLLDGQLKYVGKRFGRLVVLEIIQASRARKTPHQFVCQCDCGKQTTTRSDLVRNGFTKSCGCYRRQASSENHRTHGEASHGNESVEWKAWKSMKGRTNPNDKQNFKNYAGRGITVCGEWLASFDKFLEDMGRCPDGFTIDRIDNDKGYFPGNCRWATQEQQMNNTRANVVIEYQGRRQTLTQWCKELKIRRGLVYCRLSLGWSAEKALTSPIDTTRKKKQQGDRYANARGQREEAAA